MIEHGRLVGVVTRVDVLDALTSNDEAECCGRVARVDLGAIERNCARLAARAAPARLCAVVKADGYGHGAVPAARAAQAGGAAWLAVATAERGGRAARRGRRRPAADHGRAVGGGAARRARGARRRRRLAREVRRARCAARPRVHVKLDTGHGPARHARPGRGDARRRRRRGGARPPLAGAMTHFATADDDPAFARRAARRLPAVGGRAAPTRGAADPRRQLGGHAAAIPESRFDMVRCGIAIYGMDPFQRDPAEPRARARARARELRRGGQADRAGRERGLRPPLRRRRETTWLATMPIGYGDGVRRALTNNADVLIGGRRVPLAGTVSMDNITVDLGRRAAAAAPRRC